MLCDDRLAEGIELNDTLSGLDDLIGLNTQLAAGSDTVLDCLRHNEGPSVQTCQEAVECAGAHDTVLDVDVAALGNGREREPALLETRLTGRKLIEHSSQLDKYTVDLDHTLSREDQAAVAFPLDVIAADVADDDHVVKCERICLAGSSRGTTDMESPHRQLRSGLFD